MAHIQDNQAQNQKEALVVAVLGATGLVGRHLIEILEQRRFPVKTLKPLASQRSLGSTVRFAGQDIPVIEATPDAFDGVDIVLASAGASVSEKLVPEAIQRGAVVIDNTSFFRMHDGVPLVVAGVNDADIALHNGVIANPNCSTAQLMPVLKALHEQLAPLDRVIVSTYQSVSGAGKEAMAELFEATRSACGQEGLAQEGLAENDFSTVKQTVPPVQFKRPMAFNLIPQIDVFLEEGPCAGYTKEEYKLIAETKKILHLPALRVTATAVRVPVMIGHSEAVTLEFQRPVSVADAVRILKQTPDVVVSEHCADFSTPLETAGTDPVYVGRIRPDSSNPETGLNLWVVSDNLRIGAALNAVRIAEIVLKEGLLRSELHRQIEGQTEEGSLCR